jgi:hypothetical protein
MRRGLSANRGAVFSMKEGSMVGFAEALPLYVAYVEAMLWNRDPATGEEIGARQRSNSGQKLIDAAVIATMADAIAAVRYMRGHVEEEPDAIALLNKVITYLETL